MQCSATAYLKPQACSVLSYINLTKELKIDSAENAKYFPTSLGTKNGTEVV